MAALPPPLNTGETEFQCYVLLETALSIICWEEHVIPTSFGLSLDNFAGQEFPEHISLFLIDVIEKAKREVETCHKKLRQASRDLKDLLQSNMFEGARRRAGEVAHARGFSHMSILNNKLNNLLQNSKWDYSSDKVVNLSSTVFNREQLEVLNLGMGFCVGTTKSDFLDSISNINFFNFNNPSLKLNYLKGLVVDNLISGNIDVLPKRHREALVSLSKNQQIKRLKADKGDATVVMDTEDYISKVNSLLGDTNTYEIVSSPPTVTKLQQNFNRSLGKIAKSIPDPQQRATVLSKISSKNPSFPYFYGIPKVHKPGCPVRPIVATCNSPQDNLAEWLALILGGFIGKISDSHLIHSYDFIDRIGNNFDTDCRMVSLDVTALFTNVPLEYVLDNLRAKIFEEQLHIPIPLEPFLALVRLCVSTNLFYFNYICYRQLFGVSMGSKLSPILSNLCMEFVEKSILEHCDPHIKPLVWVRYVDDIFILFKGDDARLQQLVDRANSIVPSIKFTVELEEDNKLAFLDVLVIRDNLGPWRARQWLLMTWQINLESPQTLQTVTYNDGRVADANDSEQDSNPVCQTPGRDLTNV
ncbi:uncharacterized protein [Palaemon carinicauda]|uniref:uncharacterized protein n=1 Tax=Palaemon carinicauda TaxID=392227 RepID=UPI0035B69261